MADELKTDDPTLDQKPEEKLLSQSEVDRIVSQRLAREKERFSDYEELKKKAETLEAKIKEREEAELTELQKLQKERDDLKAQFETTTEELGKYKSTVEEIEEQTRAKVAEASEGLTDAQKTIIESLPLNKQLDAISQFKSVKPSSGDWGKVAHTGDKATFEAAQAAAEKYGQHSAQFRKAYKAYMDERR